MSTSVLSKSDWTAPFQARPNIQLNKLMGDTLLTATAETLIFRRRSMFWDTGRQCTANRPRLNRAVSADCGGNSDGCIDCTSIDSGKG